MIPVGQCLSEGETWGNRCANIIKKKVTWYEANDECQAIKGTLAVTDSKEKIRNVSITAQLQQKNGAQLWVGLYRTLWKVIPGKF